MSGERPVGRVRFMDRQRVNLDGFAVEDVDLGLVALRSPHDPEPGLVVAAGRVVEMDGVPETSFDAIDEFIARHGLDLDAAAEAMALPDAEFARRAVDPGVPRAEVTALSAGATPAKLTRVLALLTPPELGIAMAKLRARRTPSNQAHVTNRLDDPLLLAADAATAAGFGFREIETTVLSSPTRRATRSRAWSARPWRPRVCSSSARWKKPSNWSSACAGLPPTPRPSRSTAPSR